MVCSLRQADGSSLAETCRRELLLVGGDETHPHPGIGAGLTGEPRGAGPGAEALVVLRLVVLPHVTVPTPAVAVRGAGKFHIAARLRPAGESAREIRFSAVAKRGQDIAPSNLAAEEVRRARHHDRVRRFCRHPIDAGEMEAADAAGLMAAGAADIVEPPREARDRLDVLLGNAFLGRLLQRANDVVVTEHRRAGG